MATRYAQPGEVIDAPLGDALPTATTEVLFRAAAADMIRLVLPAGKFMPEHKVSGELIVFCLEGKVEFSVLGNTSVLVPGQMLYLSPAQVHAVRALEASSLLLTRLRLQPPTTD